MSVANLVADIAQSASIGRVVYRDLRGSLSFMLCIYMYWTYRTLLEALYSFPNDLFRLQPGVQVGRMIARDRQHEVLSQSSNRIRG